MNMRNAVYFRKTIRTARKPWGLQRLLRLQLIL